MEYSKTYNLSRGVGTKKNGASDKGDRNRGEPNFGAQSSTGSTPSSNRNTALA